MSNSSKNQVKLINQQTQIREYLSFLFKKAKDLTFLVGAGISRNAPSCVPSANEMNKILLKYCAPREEFEKLKNINNLRFEKLMQEIKDFYDPNLKIMDFYETVTKPNSIHYSCKYHIEQVLCYDYKF